MEGHNGTKHAENDIRLPLDIRKGRRHKIRQCKVKDPIARRTQSHALRSVLEWKHFRGVDPGRRRPGETVHGDEDVGERDDGFAWGAGDFPLQRGVAVYFVDGVAVDGHDGGDGVVDDHAEDCAGDKQEAPADAVDVG